jgi:hypothetical protein
MKYILFLTFAFCLNFYANSQQTYKVEFPDGEQEITIDYDDPSRLPKWNLGFSFFSVMAASQNEPNICFRLQPEYRINEKLMIDANFCTPFSKSIEIDQAYFKNEQTKTVNFTTLAHYQLLYKPFVKTKKTPVNYKQSGSSTTVYTVKMERNFARSIEAIGGFNFLKVPGNSRIASVTNLQDSFYYSNSQKFLSLCAGISYVKSESIKITSEDGSRAYWRYNRVYAYLTTALTGNVEARMAIKSSSFSGGVERTVSASDGFVKPDISRIGYRIGAERHLGTKNSGFSMVIGIEVGSTPYAKFDLLPGAKPSKGFFLFHMGFGFGQNVGKD